MSIIPTYESRIETPSIGLLLDNLKYGKIDLCPLYQRGDVWSDEMRSNFIDSILNGIIPNNVTFNKDYKNGSEKLICIDGKQRLTSIQLFHENKIPHIKYNEYDQVTYTYFDTMPKNIKDNIEYIILSEEERGKLFLARQLPVAYYSNLEYNNQVDVYSRINHSKPATYGEIFLSRFSNDDTAKILKKFMEEHNFCDDKRGKQYKFLFNTMYMIHKDDIKLLKNGSRIEDNLIKELDNPTKIKDFIKKSEATIARYYSKNICMHSKINKLRMSQNFIIAIGYLIYDNCDGNDSDGEIRHVIIKIWNDWKDSKERTCGTNKILKKLEESFQEQLKNKYVSDDNETDNTLSVESNDSSDESNDSYESTESTESDNDIHLKKRRIRQIVNKNITKNKKIVKKI